LKKDDILLSFFYGNFTRNFALVFQILKNLYFFRKKSKIIENFVNLHLKVYCFYNFK